MDDLKTTNYGSITDSSDNALDEKGVSGNGIFDRSVSVTTNTNPNYKTIEVEVSWSKYSVITSYSIHYTKLYDLSRMRRMDRLPSLPKSLFRNTAGKFSLRSAR